MSDQHLGKKEDAKTNVETLPPPGMVSNWCQSQNEIVKVDFEWTIEQFAFLKPFETWGDYHSSEFSHKNRDSLKWKLHLWGNDYGLKLFLESTSPSQARWTTGPVRVKISIANRKREKIFQKQNYLSPFTKLPYTVWLIEKKTTLLGSDCLVNGKLTIYCEIEEYIKTTPTAGKAIEIVDDSQKKPFSNSHQLVIAQMEHLFENKKYSDITINVCGYCEFKAHKNILATRSSYFAAMFDHPTKENLSNQIEIDDIEPDVFHEILRFIYTGRVSQTAMEKMCLEILAVADQYLLDQLKIECETHFVSRMSTESCLQLLLVTDEQHPAFHLKKYAVDFFRRFPSEVMATDDWGKAFKDQPEQFSSMIEKLFKPPLDKM